MGDPAEKYRDKVDPSHKMAMDAVCFCRQLLEPHAEHLDRFIQSERDMHNIGGLLDPTLYKDMINNKSFARQIRLAKAARAFLGELNAVSEELEKEGVL